MLSKCDIQVIEVAEAERWQDALDAIGRYDFYHLPSYHRLAEMCGEGKAVMFVYRSGGCNIGFPMLVRDIDLPLPSVRGRSLKDVTSVYGYAGPVASLQDTPENVRAGFAEALDGFFHDHQIICAFSRLHPLFNQHSILEGCGEIVPIGFTVSIDLTLPEEEQYARYRSGHRRMVKNLAKCGVTCQDVSKDYLEDFIRLYYETMDRVGADPSYYFSRDYFAYLMSEMADIFHLFVCLDGETITCAGLFTLCNGVIQYHLSGTAGEYTKTSPVKLMIDTVRRWGNESGAWAVHLGGGVGAKRDSLHAFKIGFGSREHEFTCWRHVVDERTYQEISQEAVQLAGVEPGDDYFPKYRHPALQTAGVLTHVG